MTGIPPEWMAHCAPAAFDDEGRKTDPLPPAPPVQRDCYYGCGRPAAPVRELEVPRCLSSECASRRAPR